LAVAILLSATFTRAQCRSDSANVDGIVIQFWNDILAVNRNYYTNGSLDISGTGYQWYVDDTPSPGDTMSYIYGQPRLERGLKYQLRFFLLSSKDTMCTEPVYFIPQVSALAVYPNPVRDAQLTVRHAQFEGSARLLSIYTTSGKLVYSQNASEGETTTLNVAHLPQGLYLVRAGRHVATVLIEK
ncbi:MAG: T9SS type A sorting domain-containing protein, partial [Prevotellaceae bacterium]|nr:T9SS type A sorting domain-containing protein [Prevotellaceae bacterium]